MLNKEILTNIFKKLLEEAKNSYGDFNSADGKIGDGDVPEIPKGKFSNAKEVSDYNKIRASAQKIIDILTTD